MVSFCWKMDFPHNKIQINSVLLMMSLKLTIKIVAFFLGHPVCLFSNIQYWTKFLKLGVWIIGYCCIQVFNRLTYSVFIQFLFCFYSFSPLPQSHCTLHCSFCVAGPLMNPLFKKVSTRPIAAVGGLGAGVCIVGSAFIQSVSAVGFFFIAAGETRQSINKWILNKRMNK